MLRIKQREMQTIIRLFEIELSSLPRVSKFEKMKIRKRIANAILPAFALSNQEPELFVNMIENKLRDVFDLFYDRWGFREKLHDRVDRIFKHHTITLNKTRRDEKARPLTVR